MMSRIILIWIICVSLSGCSDYQTGYNAGYDGIDKKQWIVFGRTDYDNGYHAGQAEKFQQDWLAENPVDTLAMTCPTPRISGADPLTFLPAGYNRIAQDTYQMSQY